MYILPFCAEQAFSPPHQRLASLLIALCVHVSGLIDVYVRLFVCAMFGDCVQGSLCQHMEVSAQICGRALSQMCLFLYFVCILSLHVVPIPIFLCCCMAHEYSTRHVTPPGGIEIGWLL